MSVINHIESQWNKFEVVCRHCEKIYIQTVTDQIAGLRDRDYDICPYCHECNGSSMEFEFTNRKKD